MSTYSELKAQAEELLRKAEEARKTELKDVIARLKADIATYGVRVEDLFPDIRLQRATPRSRANCHDPCGSPWMMEDTGGVRASAGRGRSIL